MKNYNRTLLIMLSPFLLSTLCQKMDMNRYGCTLNSDWHICSSSDVKEDGDQISTPDYIIQDWYPATVPTTVLAALVKNDVYQDPYFGKNLKKIPTEQFKQPWWYRTAFMLNENEASENVRLVFEGINYCADIWLNGQKLTSADTLRGSFRIFELDITKHVTSGENILAVKVYPPKPGDFTIGFVDWNPRPPDENMGIWREVKLRLNGAVSINNVFVQSKVNLKTLDIAALTISADLINHKDQKISGIIKGEIENIKIVQPFALEPHQKQHIVFSPDQYDVLNINNPRLWWPNNLGKPNLYKLQLNVLVNKDISDAQTIHFGIREVSDYMNEEGQRGYKINGKKVVIRGGGWTDDMMLADDDKKVEAQVQYTRHMNLNTIRLEGFWGSSQKLYDLADQYGILLMPGWNCQWEHDFLYGGPIDQFGGIKKPEDMSLIAQSLQDQVIWLRNHPSIFVWVYGSDKLPRPALEKQYLERLAQIDTTRPSLAACSALVSEITGPTGVKMAGPYDYVTPNYWYIDKNNGGAFGFNTETGPGPQPPPLESVKKMIPENHLWPIDDMWNYHAGRLTFNTMNRYINALEHRYGKPQDLNEFLLKAQVASYEAIRPMFEAFAVNRFNSTGVIQWMLNSAWPETYWQLYDYYLLPNGAFYGTQVACQPLNLVFNYGDHKIWIFNDTYNDLENLKTEIRILDINSKMIFSDDIPVNIGENESKAILELPQMTELNPVYFLDLKLKDSSGKICGSNFYWLSTKEDVLDETATEWYVTPNKQFADFTALNNLPEVELNVDHEFKKSGEKQEVHVTLENPSETIAFFVELKVYGKESGNTILPIFWQKNYISLLPGETKNIKAYFYTKVLNGEAPGFTYSGWNIR